MSKNKNFDFWYAVNNTEIISLPDNRLETFGNTIINYYLASELMDDVGKIRIRKGNLQALKPEIITPFNHTPEVIEGEFGSEAQEYADWLRQNGKDLKLLKYGFKIQKKEFSESVVSDRLDNVVDRIKEDLAENKDPMSTLIVGVDDPWEVCLLKLMVELVQQSAKGNIEDLQTQQNQLKEDLRKDVENRFFAAAKNPSQITELGNFLSQKGLFKQYEDRFFALVKSSER